jgi:hypothetical protein
VRRAARDDEHSKEREHPTEWEVAALTDKPDKSERESEISERD